MLFSQRIFEIATHMAVEKRYVEVLLPLKLKDALTYRLPEAMAAGESADGIRPGTWVEVPLRGHPALGVVLAILDSAPTDVSLFIAELSWSVWDMLFLEETERTLDSFYEANYFYQRFSIGAGYGYNLVLGQQHWLLHASLIPMWTFYEMLGWRKDGKRERVNYPYGKIAYAGSAHVGVYYRWGTRWSLGFSSVVNQMASSPHFSSKASGFQRFGGQEWQAILSLGCRF